MNRGAPIQTYIQACLHPTSKCTHTHTHKQMRVGERRTGSGLGLNHAFFSSNMAMRLIPQPPECARLACESADLPGWQRRGLPDARRAPGPRVRERVQRRSGDKVWESQHGCGASPTLTQLGKPFQSGEMSTCRSARSLPIHSRWVMATPSRPCRCRLAWYLLKFLCSGLFSFVSCLFSEVSECKRRRSGRPERRHAG